MMSFLWFYNPVRNPNLHLRVLFKRKIHLSHNSKNVINWSRGANKGKQTQKFKKIKDILKWQSTCPASMRT
jgi:hypothetical protein